MTTTGQAPAANPQHRAVDPPVTVDTATRVGAPTASPDLEAGTPPEDRRFRPDIEGLRAVAVLLVVLYHAGVSRITGGYVGVDVFFVISGFVITGLLLRERAVSGRTSILHFYARRVRRIIPAATLVILVAVGATYVSVDSIAGNTVADDGRWAAVFLANFHFASAGTNYFTATLPPSPLQNFWSLSVEEQFYVVFPTVFLLVAKLKVLSFRARLAGVLVVLTAVSYAMSVVQTSSEPTAAYFSPFTRAWELALGALVAVGTPWLVRLPRRIGAPVSWAGVGAVLFAAFAFKASTPYPGSLVAVPVVGAALIIAGGTSTPRLGAETVLGRRPFQWVGRRSYSWYLWHWPLFVIAAQASKLQTLSLGENLILVVVSLGLAAATFALLEQPVRHWNLPSATSVAAGVSVIVVTVVLLSLAIAQEPPVTAYPVTPATSSAEVSAAVARALEATTVPHPVQPPLPLATTDWGGRIENHGCVPGITESEAAICTLGDPTGTHLLVVYGDSHALMWLPAFDAIASAARWRLVVLAKPACPAAAVTVVSPDGVGPANGPFTSCAAWHRWAVQWINADHPTMLVLTEVGGKLSVGASGSGPQEFSESAWQHGVADSLASLRSPGTAEVVLGETPVLPISPVPCLRQNSHDVQACSTPTTTASPSAYTDGERAAAGQAGARYIDALPWFCTTKCPAVVAGNVVYMDNDHITATYARYLQVVLGDALDLPAAAGRPSS